MSEDQDRMERILLAEYAEAGQVTRQHENLTRAAAAFFSALLSAIAGYLIGGGDGTPEPNIGFVLSIVGALLSCLAYLMIRRHQQYYCFYLSRVKDIECKLKYSGDSAPKLYTRKLPDGIKKSGSIKNLFCNIFISVACAFLGFGFWFAYKLGWAAALASLVPLHQS